MEIIVVGHRLGRTAWYRPVSTAVGRVTARYRTVIIDSYPYGTVVNRPPHRPNVA